MMPTSNSRRQFLKGVALGSAALTLPAASVIALEEESAPTKATSWHTGIEYKAGDIVTYQNCDYVALVDHTTNDYWLPPKTPQLWIQK
jgi:hypothetical protein